MPGRRPRSTRAQEGAEVRLGETETHSQNTVTTPRSEVAIPNQEKRET